MAQKQIQLKQLERGRTFCLGDNTSLHLFVSDDKEIFIKLRKEDVSKGRVFTLNINQWLKLQALTSCIKDWIESILNN